MKTYDEYMLDEECSLIEEGVLNFVKGKLMKDKKVATDDGKTINIAADYRSLRELVSKLGSLLTDGKYKEALETAKKLEGDVTKNVIDSIDTLVKGQEKIKSLKNPEQKKEDDGVDGDELTANVAASVKTKSIFNY